MPPTGSARLFDLEPGKNYSVRIMVESQDGQKNRTTESIMFQTTKAVVLPTNVKISDITDNSATVSWTIPGDEDSIGSILVQFKEGTLAETDWKSVTLLPSTDSFTMRDLEPGMHYTVRVGVATVTWLLDANSGVSESLLQYKPTSMEWTNASTIPSDLTGVTMEVSFTTEGKSHLCLPLPTEVTIGNITGDGATVSWTNPEDGNNLVGNIIIQYKTDDSDTWTNVTVTPPADSVRLSDLEDGKEYTVRIVVETADSSVSSITTPVTFVSALSLPHDIHVVNITTSQATVTWLLDANSGVSESLLQYKATSDMVWTNVSTIPSDITSYTLTGLSIKTEYAVRLLSFGSYETSTGVTEEVSFTTEVVVLPTNVKISDITDDSATVSWTIPGDEDSIAFIVVQIKKGTDAETDWKSVTVLPSTDSFTFRDLEPGMHYTVRVGVVSRDGLTRRTTTAETFVTGLPLPTEITIGNITSGGATVSWTNPEDDNNLVGNIIIQYKTDDSDTWTNVTVTPPADSVRLSDLEDGKKYTVRIVVETADGSVSSITTPVTFVTGVPLPKDISIGDITSDAVTVSWTNPEDVHLIGTIVVQYKTDDSDVWTNVTVIPQADSVTLSNLEPGRTYILRIVVESPDGSDSSTSTPLTFTTGVTIGNITGDGATVSWTNPEDGNNLVGNIIIQYKTDDSDTWTNVTVTPPADSVRLSDLEDGKKYTVRIIVETADGSISSITTPVTFVTGMDFTFCFD
ncbi:tenascin-R-like [Glandiceps talaboti]